MLIKKKKENNGFVLSVQKMYNSVLFNHNWDIILSTVYKDRFKYEAPISIFLCLLRELSKEHWVYLQVQPRSLCLQVIAVLRGRWRDTVWWRERDWSANMHICKSCLLVFVQAVEPEGKYVLLVPLFHKTDTHKHLKRLLVTILGGGKIQNRFANGDFKGFQWSEAINTMFDCIFKDVQMCFF